MVKKMRSDVREILEKTLFTVLHCLPEQALLIFKLLFMTSQALEQFKFCPQKWSGHKNIKLANWKSHLLHNH